MMVLKFMIMLLAPTYNAQHTCTELALIMLTEIMEWSTSRIRMMNQFSNSLTQLSWKQVIFPVRTEKFQLHFNASMITAQQKMLHT